VGGPAGTRDDDAQAPFMGGLPVPDHFGGHPVGGNHIGFKRDAEFGQGISRGLHHRPVRI